MSPGLDDDLALIIRAARAGGQTALAMRQAGLTTQAKSDGSPISDADLAVDELLRTTLGAARPDYGWLSEETADDPARLARRRLFVVDPIDGTAAFVRGRPWWTVSIAVVEDGRPIAGVVFAPAIGGLYSARNGAGARLNDAPIRASTTPHLEDSAMLGDAKMFAHARWTPPWPPMRVESRNSIALRLCLVAQGAFDAALALSAKSEWDLAAGDLIAGEAGCTVTDQHGRPFAYNRPDTRAPGLICAGPALHRLILPRVAPIERAG